MKTTFPRRCVAVVLTASVVFAVFLHAEEPKKVTADKERIIKAVRFLSEENFPRTAKPENKVKTLDYIAKSLTAAGLEATREEFVIVGQEGTYTNVHALKKGKTDKRIVVGAHYDIIAESPGADDNASGVAVLLELAHMLKDRADLNCGIEFAAYDIEEMGMWGSQHHAKTLKEQKVNVVGMLCLEMVGFFSDADNSQTYPVSGMSLLYGTKGDFLAMIGGPDDTKLIADAQKAFREATTLKILSLPIPKGLELLFSRSDHAPFLKEGYPALLFTDTADYRSQHYHQKSDTWDTLDYERMTQVAVGLYHIILALDVER